MPRKCCFLYNRICLYLQVKYVFYAGDAVFILMQNCWFPYDVKFASINWLLILSVEFQENLSWVLRKAGRKWKNSLQLPNLQINFCYSHFKIKPWKNNFQGLYSESCISDCYLYIIIDFYSSSRRMFPRIFQ